MANPKLKLIEAAYYGKYFSLYGQYIGDPPDIVYHYTNLSAFASIVTRKRLWASQAEFLNDANEFRYGLAICSAESEKIARHGEKYSNFIKFLKKAMEIGSNSPFVTCFCNDGDLLSQWRAYSSHGQGLSIGFRSELLAKIELARLRNVLYDVRKQSDFLSAHIKLLADSFLSNDVDLNDSEIFRELVGYTGDLERTASLLKDPAFREENETRISISDYNVKKDPAQVLFRSKNNLIIPYTALTLETLWPSIIHDIVIGPGPDPETRKKNVEHFLNLNGLQSVEVKVSRCQLRQ